MFPIHVDPDLELRPFAVDEAESSFALLSANRAHLDPWMRWTASVQTLDDTRAYIERAADNYAAGTGFHAGIWRRGELKDELLGGFACPDLDRGRHHAEIGYWLGATYVGQGIVQRVARVVITELFTRENLHASRFRQWQPTRPAAPSPNAWASRLRASSANRSGLPTPFRTMLSTPCLPANGSPTKLAYTSISLITLITLVHFSKPSSQPVDNDLKPRYR